MKTPGGDPQTFPASRRIPENGGTTCSGLTLCRWSTTGPDASFGKVSSPRTTVKKGSSKGEYRAPGAARCLDCQAVWHGVTFGFQRPLPVSDRRSGQVWPIIGQIWATSAAPGPNSANFGARIISQVFAMSIAVGPNPARKELVLLPTVRRRTRPVPGKPVRRRAARPPWWTCKDAAPRGPRGQRRAS